MAQATFINIPTEALTGVLTTAGFTDVTATLPRSRYGHVGERVFDREHHRFSNVKVRVYTSIDRITNLVRDIDLDRIVVCAVYTDGTKLGHDRKASGRFLFSAKGVNRSSGEADQEVAVKAILDRMLSRMRGVYGQINKAEVCPNCGEPVRVAKSRKKWFGRSYGRRSAKTPNPNYKRPFKACLSDACKYFEWTGPVVDETAPESAGLVTSSPVIAIRPKPGSTSLEGATIIRADEPELTTEARFEHDDEPPQPEPDFESETFESTDGVTYHKPNVEPAPVDNFDRLAARQAELDERNARIAARRAKLDADNGSKQVSVTDARAMFSRP